MAEYIDRDLALSFPLANGKYDKTNADEHFIGGCETYREWLESLPAEDVRPVVRGEWNAEIDHRYGVDNWRFYCSKCGFVEVHAYFDWKRHNYCPNCGADMRKEAQDG